MSKKYIIFIVIIKIIYCFIVLPLDTLPRENYKDQYDINSPKYIINNEYKEIFFTELEIGTPIQKIPLILKTEASSFIVTSINSKENCTSYQYRDNFNFSQNFFKENNYEFFNENKSESYILNNCDYPKIYEAEELCNSNETFLFYTDKNLKNKVEAPKLYFELMRNVEDNITGEIGLNLYDRNYWTFNSFLGILKTRNIIENYNWFFDFDSYDSKKGKLVIGALPHQIYPENYKSDDMQNGKATFQSLVIYWRIQFNKIYIKENKNKGNIKYFNDTLIEFKFDSNAILGTPEYENYILNIFSQYLNEKKCFNDTILDYKLYSNKLKFFYCKNDNKLKKDLYSLLPDLYFYSNEINYTFEIKNNDLWKITNDYIYYKVLFGTQNNKIWSLGKIISLKYKFIFNPESKQILFYNKYYNKKGNTSSNNNYYIYFIKIGIIILLSCLLVFLGIKIGKMIYGIKRKKRANELVDDYDYMLDENKNKNIKEEHGINN